MNLLEFSAACGLLALCVPNYYSMAIGATRSSMREAIDAHRNLSEDLAPLKVVLIGGSTGLAIGMILLIVLCIFGDRCVPCFNRCCNNVQY